MPDINLLKDTRRPDEEKKKSSEKKPRIIEMTKVEKQAKKGAEPKPPSTIAMFFKSLFSGFKKNKKEIRQEEKTEPPLKRVKKEPQKDKGVEDIFEDVVVKEPEIPETPEEKKPEEKKPEEPKKIEELAPKPAEPSMPEPTKKESPRIELPKEEISEDKKVKKESFKIIRRLFSDRKSKDHKKGELVGSESSFLVNLLPSDLVGPEKPKEKLIGIAISLLISSVAVGLVYVGILLYESNIASRTEDVKKDSTLIVSEITGFRSKQKASVDFKEKLDAVRNLLDSHIYWTKFFEKLEKYTHERVYYTGSINLGTGGKLNLQASAPDFKTVSEQLVVLRNAPDFVQEVSITSATRESVGLAEGIAPGSTLSSRINFAISITMVPDILIQSENEFSLAPSATIPSAATAPSSSQKCESDIFDCYYILTQPSDRAEGYLELQLRGVVDPTYELVSGQLAPITVGETEITKCIFGTEGERENAKYIKCTILEENYITGAEVEISLPFTSFNEIIKVTLPGTGVSGEGVGLDTNINTNINSSG